MIRFIDLRGQIDITAHLEIQFQKPCFAFYDTSRGGFVSCGQQEVWFSWREFVDDYKVTEPQYYPLEEYHRLCPTWVPDCVMPVKLGKGKYK